METILFYTFSTILILSAMLVITVRNPVHAVLMLILSFLNTSALFILLGAEYLAMTLIVVYVGAIAILFLFVIMMMDIDVAMIKQGFSKHFYLGIVIGLIMIIEIIMAFLYSEPVRIKSPDSLMLSGMENIKAIGMLLYTKYFFPFQAGGVILLIAMMGAIILTLHTSSKMRRQSMYDQVARSKEDCIKLVDVKPGDKINNV